MFRDRNDLLVGRRFGPYRIEATLGKGTVAVAYLALNSDDEKIALKILTPLAQANPDIRSSFEREFLLMKRLDHPNIVRVRRTGTIAGVGYIEMDLVEGPTLLDHLRSAAPSAADIADFGATIARALDEVHRLRIVHRDVKPANVLLDGDEPRLFDFGLALDLDDSTSVAGRIYGSPLYLSPEQALAGPPVDGRADLYALGASLYHLLAGQPPFRGERMELLRGHVESDPPPIPAHDSGTRALVDTISWTMSKDPERRPQSGVILAEHLEDVGVALRTEASSGGPPTARKLPRRSWLRRRD